MIGANLGLVLTMLIWGAQVPLIALMAERYDPYLLALIRYAGALPLLLIVLRLREPGPLFRDYSLRWLMLLGAAVAAFGTFYTLGVALCHPVTAAVLSAMSPAIAALVAWAVLRTPPSLLVVLALLLVAVGGVLATVDLSYVGTFRLRGGEGLILLASAAWSWYSIEAQRRLKGASQIRISALTLIFTSAFLAVVYGLAAAFGQTYGSALDATLPDLATFALFIVGVVLIGLLLWNFGVSRLGVVIASMYLNLIPIAAVLTALALGYEPRAEQLVGGTVVLAGVVLAQYGHRLRRLGASARQQP